MKTSKRIVVAALVMLLGCSLKGMAQTVQYVPLLIDLHSFDYIPCSVHTNQLVSVVGYMIGSGQVYGTTADGTTIPLSPPSSSNPIQIYTGLTNVFLQTPYNVTNYVTLQITTPASATVVSNYVPADAIVIPASATGNVQIILESSPDLVNWTAAEPGTYGASAGTNRFFRVRAVVN
jgi:hypothetical protein